MTVPNAIGKARADALAELEKAGLDVRVVEDKLDPNASGPVGSVVAQLPKAGEQIKTGGRVTLQIMSAPTPPPVAAASPALPRIGDIWEYRSRSVWRNVEPRTYSHQVTAVSDREVRETMSSSSSAGKASESKTIGPDTRFVEWRGQGYSYVEFNPFIGAFGGLQPGTAWKSLPIPVDDPFFGNWSTHGRASDWDSVTVPAGTFKAMRVEINSNRAPTGSVAMRASEPVRILNVIWYAPDAKRAVKLVRTVYSTSGTRLDEETLRAREISRPVCRSRLPSVFQQRSRVELDRLESPVLRRLRRDARCRRGRRIRARGCRARSASGAARQLASALNIIHRLLRCQTS